jgi:hypothetical protein
MELDQAEAMTEGVGESDAARVMPFNARRLPLRPGANRTLGGSGEIIDRRPVPRIAARRWPNSPLSPPGFCSR